MKRTGFDETRDQQIANEAAVDRSLMCSADRCPRKWTVSVGGSRGLCCAHGCSDRSAWPRITQQILDDEIDQARYGSAPKAEPQPVDRSEALRQLRTLRLGAVSGTQWAESLRRRELAGQNLTLFQREAWREVLGQPPKTGAWEEALP